MGIIEKIAQRFREPIPIKHGADDGHGDALCDAIRAWYDATSEYKVRDLALQTAIGKVARSLAKCEIKTYYDGEEKKQLVYYKLNYAPNANQNGTAWMNELVARLFLKNEALVVELADDLHVADAYTRSDEVLKPWTFSQVVVDDFELRRTFRRDRDVMFFQLANDDIRRLVNQVYETYAEMMGATAEVIKAAGGVKGVINLQGMITGTEADREKLKELMSRNIRALWEKRDAVVLIPQGYQYQDLKRDLGSESSRDYKAMIDDVYDFTAAAFGIPPVLLKGQVAEIGDVYDMYLTDCIEPLAKMLSVEMTRYFFKPSEIAKGSRVAIDTSRIKHFDLFDAAGAIEKLIGSGALTINEVRDHLGVKATDDEVGNKHLITKNFGSAEEVTTNEDENTETVDDE